MYRRGIRYVSFQGGEPLLHPEIEGLVADAHASGMRPVLITNGWLLPQKIKSLIAAGLGTLLVSIDSHSLEDQNLAVEAGACGQRTQSTRQSQLTAEGISFPRLFPPQP